jgi:hypothetical protein
VSGESRSRIKESRFFRNAESIEVITRGFLTTDAVLLWILTTIGISYLLLGYWMGWETWTRLPPALWPVRIFSGDYWTAGLISYSMLTVEILVVSILLIRFIGRPIFRNSSILKSPLDKASFISIATFWWIRPTLISSQSRTLELEDLPVLAAADQPDGLNLRLSSYCITENYSAFLLMVRVIFSIQPGVFLWSFFSGWLFLSAMFLDPILLRMLLTSTGSGAGERTNFTATLGSSAENNITNTDDGRWRADLAQQLGLVLLLSASMMIRVTFMEQVRTAPRCILCERDAAQGQMEAGCGWAGVDGGG